MNILVNGYKALMLSMIFMTFSGEAGRCINADRDLINEENIAKVQVHNVKAQLKEVKDEASICKIVSLVNSVNIIEKEKSKTLGIGYGVVLTYKDGHKESFSFLGNRMLMKSNWYKIDKDISVELKRIYDGQ